MEARASEYADAILALKKNAESLVRQRDTVASACDQLFHTAYREAMQAHLKNLIEAAASGASRELLDAARNTVDDLSPPELVVAQQAGPAYKSTQPDVVNLAIGMCQP